MGVGVGLVSLQLMPLLLHGVGVGTGVAVGYGVGVAFGSGLGVGVGVGLVEPDPGVGFGGGSGRMSPVGVPLSTTSGIEPSGNDSLSSVISPDPLMVISVMAPLALIVGSTWPVTERPRQSKVILVPTNLGSNVTSFSKLKVLVS